MALGPSLRCVSHTAVDRQKHQQDADRHQRDTSVVEQVVVGMGEKVADSLWVHLGGRVVFVNERPAPCAA